jgi:restriction endonuclease S subunit
LNIEITNTINDIFNKEKHYEKLVNIADNIQSGGTPKTNIKEYWENGDINWIRSEVCQNCYVYEEQVKDTITQLGMEKSNTKIFPKDTILVALVGATLGKIGYLTFDSCTNQNIAGIFNLRNVIPKYLFYILMNFKELNKYGKGDFKMLSITNLREFKIPVPSIEKQKDIVLKIENIEKEIKNAKNELKKLEELKKKVLEENL